MSRCRSIRSLNSSGGTVATVSRFRRVLARNPTRAPGFGKPGRPGRGPNVDLASQFVQLLTAKYAFARERESGSKLRRYDKVVGSISPA